MKIIVTGGAGFIGSSVFIRGMKMFAQTLTGFTKCHSILLGIPKNKAKVIKTSIFGSKTKIRGASRMVRPPRCPQTIIAKS